MLLECLAPYDALAEELSPILSRATHIVFAEEGIRAGGASVLLYERLGTCGAFRTGAKVQIVAIEDFAAPQRLCDLYDHTGLSARALAERFLASE